MKNTATISGRSLLLGLNFVRSLARNTSTAGTEKPTVNEDGMRRDGYEPHPRAISVLCGGKNDGYPVSLAWPQMFVWGGHPEEAGLIMRVLEMASRGLENVGFPIDVTLSRIRVNALGEDALRRFLIMLATGELRERDLLVAAPTLS